MTTRLRLVANPEPRSPHGLLGGSVSFPGHCGEAITDLQSEPLGSHLSRLGARPHASGRSGAALIDALEDIALTGRGGAHFPVARKWRSVRAALEDDRLADGAIVVANGAEGEPLSGKDAALLEFRPHLVLDGLACAAEALDATDVVIWLHESAHEVRTAITRALAERSAARLSEPAMRMVLGPHRYLSGESSAIVRALAGGPALPQFRRNPAVPARVDRRPVLVQNVETLARIALAARGQDAVGSTLVSVAAPGQRAVLEVIEGARITDVVTAVAGNAHIQAVLVGGYGGSWVSWNDLGDAAVNERALRARGLSLGAGVLEALPTVACGLARTAEIAGYLADSSARQCGPCLFGLRGLADVTVVIAGLAGRRTEDKRIRRFLAEVSGRGACHHPDGAVRMISTALVAFADDLSAHLEGRCLHAPTPRARAGGHRG